MPRRIDIELTSALSDGSYTWRAAGAREPKGVLAGSILPPGASVGDELKVEVEQMMDGIEVLSVVKGREKAEPDLLELLPSEQPFEAVIETRAKRDRSEGRGRRDDRGPRGRGRDGKGRDGRGRDGKGRDGRGRDGRREGGARDDRDDRRRDDDRDQARDGGRRGRRDRPHFDPPPEVPQRPKPKRLRPGKAHRNEVLAALPEDQRPIAEVALQGMAAVRTRVAEENEKLAAAGKPVMPESSVVKMAEELLPKLRVADWLDRADAALRQIEHLDLRDLRSVVAAGSDSIVARDESTRAVAEQLHDALVRKQEEELALWLEDVDAALSVGRAIRALRLSSQPPKAGVMFPPDLARRLAEAATNSLQPDDSADRWAAVMEAAAFSPVRALIAPSTPPREVTDDLRKTALRLGPLLPQVAELLGVEVPPNAPKPKPLRPQHRKDAKKDGRKDGKRDGKRDPRADGRRNDGRDGRKGEDRTGDARGAERQRDRKDDRAAGTRRDRKGDDRNAEGQEVSDAPAATSPAATVTSGSEPSTDAPAETPADTAASDAATGPSTEVSAVPPAPEPASQTPDSPTETASETASDTPGETSSEPSTDATAERPAPEPAPPAPDAPADTSTDAPAAAPASEPAPPAPDAPTAAPAAAPTPEPAPPAPDAPADTSTDAPAAAPTPEPAPPAPDAPTAAPATEPAAEPSTDTTPAPAPEPAAEPSTDAPAAAPTPEPAPPAPDTATDSSSEPPAVSEPAPGHADEPAG